MGRGRGSGGAFGVRHHPVVFAVTSRRDQSGRGREADGSVWPLAKALVGDGHGHGDGDGETSGVATLSPRTVTPG